jgi:hypothetical protein
MKKIVGLMFMCLLSLTLLPVIATVKAQGKTSLSNYSTDVTVPRGGKTTITGTLTAYSACDITMELYKSDFMNFQVSSPKVPASITVGEGVPVSIDIDVSPTATQGTHCMIVLGYADGEHEWTWFCWVNVDFSKVLGFTQEDHYYDGWIQYENFPRSIYGPNNCNGVTFTVKVKCPQDYYAADPNDAPYGERIWINWACAGWATYNWVGEHGLWCPKDSATSYSFNCGISSYWNVGTEEFRLFITRVNDSAILDELDVSIPINCVGSGPPDSSASTKAITMPKYDLTVFSTEGGTITPSTGTYIYNENIVVPINATPNEGYNFTCWNIDGTNVTEPQQNITMNRDHIAEAFFSKIPDIPKNPDIDTNHDGKIDILDITFVAIKYGLSKATCPNWDEDKCYLADMNSDGVVNVVDLTMVAIHYGQS